MQPGSCAKSKAKKPYLGTPGLVPTHTAHVTGQGPGATQSTDTQDATSALQWVAVCIRANNKQGLTGQALWKKQRYNKSGKGPDSPGAGVLKLLCPDFLEISTQKLPDTE